METAEPVVVLAPRPPVLAIHPQRSVDYGARGALDRAKGRERRTGSVLPGTHHVNRRALPCLPLCGSAPPEPGLELEGGDKDHKKSLVRNATTWGPKEPED